MIKTPVLALRRETPKWQRLISRAADVFYVPEDAGKVEKLYARMEAMVQSEQKGVNRPQFRLMMDIGRWRLTGEYQPSYESLNEARVQMWHCERHCPVHDFQGVMLGHMVRDYPQVAGIDRAAALHATIGAVDDLQRDDIGKELVIMRRKGAQRTIVGFADLAGRISGIGWTMFYRAVASKVDANLIVVRDNSRLYYMGGLTTAFGDLPKTLVGLRKVLREFDDGPIVATGGSAGTFGAIYMAAKLGLRHVVASSGPTSLDIGVEEGDRQRLLALKALADEGKAAYPDLLQVVADSPIRRIDFFVAGGHDFDLRQMRHLAQASDKVVPRIYENREEHTILEEAILEGSYLDALRLDLGQSLDVEPA